MSLGEIQQVSEDIYAYLQPDGSWYLNNTGFLVSRDGVVTLWSGDLHCEVRYAGTPAHTTNDSIIHIPQRSVVFAGDLLFNGGTWPRRWATWWRTTTAVP